MWQSRGIGRLRTLSKARSHNRGPNTDSCGTPQRILLRHWNPSLLMNFSPLSRKYTFMISTRYRGTPCRLRASPTLPHGRELKALAISNDTANATPPSFTTASVRERTRLVASIVDFSRKPYCSSWRPHPSRDRCWTRRVDMILSRIFPTSSNREIGLYAEGEFGSLPSLWRRTSLALLHSWGNTPCLRHSEKSSLNLPPMKSRARTQSLPGTPSGPGALRGRVPLAHGAIAHQPDSTRKIDTIPDSAPTR